MHIINSKALMVTKHKPYARLRRDKAKRIEKEVNGVRKEICELQHKYTSLVREFKMIRDLYDAYGVRVPRNVLLEKVKGFIDSGEVSEKL
ncbi:hypothetical protein ACOME3_007762 [Neoechinorhynchus agilis]